MQLGLAISKAKGVSKDIEKKALKRSVLMFSGFPAILKSCKCAVQTYFLQINMAKKQLYYITALTLDRKKRTLMMLTASSPRLTRGYLNNCSVMMDLKKVSYNLSSTLQLSHHPCSHTTAFCALGNWLMFMTRCSIPGSCGCVL